MQARILVAGIGNVFLGDDAFGVEVARRLRAAGSLPGVQVDDFGIRGLDLAFTLLAPWDLVIFVDALARGGTPGSLYLLEPELPAADASFDAELAQGHGLSPERVLGLVRALGGELRCPVRVVGCEPATFGSEDEPAFGLSASVDAAVASAAELVQWLVQSLDQEQPAVTPLVGGKAHEYSADGP